MRTQRASEIPPATDELLAAGQRKVGEGRLNLRGLKPAGTDDAETERHVEEITHSYGAHAQIPPAKEKIFSTGQARCGGGKPGASGTGTAHPLCQLSRGFAGISGSGADDAVGP